MGGREFTCPCNLSPLPSCALMPQLTFATFFFPLLTGIPGLAISEAAAGPTRPSSSGKPLCATGRRKFHKANNCLVNGQSGHVRSAAGEGRWQMSSRSCRVGRRKGHRWGEIGGWMKLKHPCGCKCWLPAKFPNFVHGIATAITAGTSYKSLHSSPL